MIISNMIIVEYLFNYNGVVYYLLYFFKRQDINGFIVLSLTLGVIFILFTWGIKSVAKFINPLKKEAVITSYSIHYTKLYEGLLAK